MTASKVRVDQALVESGLVSSRSQALLLIKEGLVFFQEKILIKPGLKIPLEDLDQLKIKENIRYVGRGAKKISGAKDFFNLNFENKIIADIGASTGGFTDFSLKNGALKVFAIDVGHDQLATTLKEDPKVINMEGVNIRHGAKLNEKVDMAVVDLSYISLTLVLKPILNLVDEQGEVLLLVKPQFEVGPENIDKGGIVKSEEARKMALKKIYKFLDDQGEKISNAMISPIKGKKGNIEYLFYINRKELSQYLSFQELDQL